jgi:hypothetical protein
MKFILHKNVPYLMLIPDIHGETPASLQARFAGVENMFVEVVAVPGIEQVYVLEILK